MWRGSWPRRTAALDEGFRVGFKDKIRVNDLGKANQQDLVELMMFDRFLRGFRRGLHEDLNRECRANLMVRVV